MDQQAENLIEQGNLLKAYGEQGNLEKVKHLIEVENVGVNQPDLFGDTCLHGAVSKGRLLIVEYLLDKKADSNITNKVGSTPLHKAVTIDPSTTTLGQQMNIIRVLLNKGADPTVKNAAGLIPEQLAFNSRIKELLQGDQAVTETISVPKVHHGKIVGKKGNNLKQLKELTNTQITVPDSNVTSNKISIKGRKDDVEKARQMILDIVNPPKTPEDEAAEKAAEEDIEILNLTTIAKEKHSLLIGARGKTIRYLRDNFDIQINVPPTESSENNISIQGKLENIDNAMKYINEILKKNSNNNNNNYNNKDGNYNKKPRQTKST
ncbi:hypothetical protein DICPUDRAFT_75557 [Dictyostelium purpureum]|uniref:K Homology domain-containing protein n=1 Tax=Dictyostelium purpureum TaxID=5786 RepID=F0ZB03_DICPU|nr:uncharacterized protein DICPUDRAFT_75557 [Dictyostelium purpureum]EGC38889.1 hypothetical protein DICPUDRAFT_75557 [Dictyostelium purpureum]|eukprot:XP_003284569.1 hypothetical protein DICPUDRAFT_75557 [Dictyostelium purpureum]